MTRPPPRLAAPVLLLALGLPAPAQGAVLPAPGHKNGVVAADHPLASAAGVEILVRGGNAVDAACAAAFALGVVSPAGSGIGGGGFMLVLRPGDPRPVALDFRETAPGATTADMFLAPGVAKDASRLGGLAVAVPGEVAGCAEAVRRFGRLPLARVVAPAIRLARRGFLVGPGLAAAVARLADPIRARPDLARTFLPGGRPLTEGQPLRRPDLARTLEAIGRSGPGVFYRGWIAKDIVEAVRAAGGRMTLEDLAAYRVKERPPLAGTFRGHTIFSMPPPSSGGVALIEALNILERYPLSDHGHSSSRHLHLVAEALKHVFADRARHLGDPDFAKVPVGALVSRAHADALARLIGERTLPTKSYGTTAPSGGSGGTSHLSVADRHGTVVALTTTINTSFGSMVVAPRSGIILNNEMDDFATRPGEPNAFGLVQAQADAPGPGKRPLSSMTPTVVVKNGKPRLVVGGSGGPTIISGTLQVLSNVLDFGLEPADAVSRTRIHHQWVPDTLQVEGDLPRDVVRGLRDRGHRVEVTRALSTAVQLVLIKNGLRFGASDPRKNGVAAGY